MKKQFILSKQLLLVVFFLLVSNQVYSVYFKHIGMEDGLSHFSVVSIYQDIHGRMWFGTNEGLTIFDGSQMNVFKPSLVSGEEMVTGALKGNRITAIVGDKEGNVFFLADNALMKYDIRKQHFRKIRSGYIRALTSSEGEIWCAYNDSVFKYDSVTGELNLQIATALSTPINQLLISSKGQMWIGTLDGLYMMNEEGQTTCLIPGIRVYKIFQSSKREIWVSSWKHGLYQITGEGLVRQIPYGKESPHGTLSNQTRELVEDNSGNLWLGTFDGLQKYNSFTDEFTLYKSDILPGSLSHSSVFSLCKDNQGTIWTGTYFGGVNYFNPEKDLFTFYPYNPQNKACLNYPLVGNMTEDREGNLWICTEGGGLNCLDRKNKTFRYFTASPQLNALPHDNLKSLCYDKERHCLYIGTHTGGLSRFDIHTGTFHNYLQEYNSGKLAPNDIINKVACYEDKLIVSARNGTFILDKETDVFEKIGENIQCFTFDIDKKGYLWMVGSNYIFRVNLNDRSEQKKISYEKTDIRFGVTRILCGSDGYVYLGSCGAGIYRLDPKGDSVTNYTTDNSQLLSNYCYNIAETHMGDLLVTCDKGIMLFNPSGQSLKAIRSGMDIPLSSIVENCGIYVCADNEIFVGGTNGMVSFWEEEVDEQNSDYKLFFSEMQINNELVYPDDKMGILETSLPFTQKINLNYDQNNLLFRFTVTNYINLLKGNRYEYKLEGFDKHWTLTSDYSLRYTNLSPGNYVLKVRELKQYAGDVPKEISLEIVIQSPWYKTAWAFLLYLVSGGLVFYFIRKNRKARRELAISLREERNEKERIERLNQEKLRFFTNISHEFRTPLTLILSHLDVLLQNNAMSPSIYNKMQKIHKHAFRMKGLITELLDFRKFEQQQITLHVSEQDIVPFLKEIYLSFSDYAVQHAVSYHFQHDSDRIRCWFDPCQLQKVFYNLLSNAFKYTPEGGAINLTVKEGEQHILIKVADSGIGISASDRKLIFDRFYQAGNGEAIAANPGTGIGLALTKGIVQMHRAEIVVESQLENGSIFTVIMQKGKDHFASGEGILIQDEHPEPTVNTGSLPDSVLTEQLPEIPDSVPVEQQGTSRYTILLVEDNEELMQVLITLFSPIYTVISAFNGEEGLEKVMNESPDLVVSDIMMPVMSGTEMCLRIKNNINLCHIPVVLLSALNSDEQNVEGLRCGADDYVGKPFSAKILLLRCNNLIRNRLFMQRKLTRQDHFDVSLLATNSLDKDFLDRIVQLIEHNLEDSHLDVNLLAREMALGRSSFFTKFKALTGMTPSSFILDYKLKKAVELLINCPGLQIAEISDRLAFNTPHYFAKCFKAQFNVSPAEYRKVRLSGN